MRKYCLIALVLALSFYFLGCGKKQQPLEEMQAPMSIESLGTVSTEVKPMAAEVKPIETKMPAASVQATTTPTTPALEALPPSGPYKPSTEEIQTALKNAGFYTGAVDGKKGPMTKKAIEEFQKAHNLTADGKVGPVTWAALEQYLKTQKR
ncbi:MAG: peptidoglycan-binding domain-containing protein [Candidatus Omnitrophica bacterium]|nr:peptidoglycan-binding domain-containing protein [Candidatus Omnitrophota bacterium]MDD5653135.1 peptidoglycan-binding domain-containing protein [Candidatus Omnitrophota bacterium]